MAKITVKDTNVTIISVKENDYICLTDIARYKSDDPNAVIGNWLRNRNTIEYLGIWESLYNPNFKPLEFEGFEIRIVQTLPNSEILDCVPVAQPVADHCIRVVTLVSSYIRQADIVVLFDRYNRNVRVFYRNLCHIRIVLIENIH